MGDELLDVGLEVADDGLVGVELLYERVSLDPIATSQLLWFLSPKNGLNR